MKVRLILKIAQLEAMIEHIKKDPRESKEAIADGEAQGAFIVETCQTFREMPTAYGNVEPEPY